VPVEQGGQNQQQSPKWRRSMDSAVAYYEECIGISEVQKARKDVNQCESLLQEATQARRQKQTELKRLQLRLKEIHTELDRTSRGEDKYLHLLTEEHKSIKAESSLMAAFEEAENSEREAFHQLSTKMRTSHEREREREERTKYWSITASLIGAILGIAGTSIGNELRMRHLKEMIPTGQQLSPLLEEIARLMSKEQEQILEVADFVRDVRNALGSGGEGVRVRSTEGLTAEKLASVLREQNADLTKQLNELRRLIAANIASTATGEGDRTAVVYVGDEIGTMLSQTERNLESKMKLQTLLGVVVVYSSLALALPLIYFLFKKDF